MPAADRPWDVLWCHLCDTPELWRVAPRALCARVHARLLLVPPNIYIHTHTYAGALAWRRGPVVCARVLVPPNLYIHTHTYMHVYV